MSADPGDLVDAEPRRRSGLGSSPLSRPMIEPRTTVISALHGLDAWFREHGDTLKAVERVTRAAPVIVAASVEAVTEPEPEATAPVAVLADPLVEPEPIAVVPVEAIPDPPAATSSLGDALAKLRAMGSGG